MPKLWFIRYGLTVIEVNGLEARFKTSGIVDFEPTLDQEKTKSSLASAWGDEICISKLELVEYHQIGQPWRKFQHFEPEN